MKTVLTRSRLRARRLKRVLLGLAVLGFIVFECKAQQPEPRIFLDHGPLNVTISGPGDGIVDRPVEFRVEVRNKAEAASKEMDLYVFAGRPDHDIYMEKGFNSVPGKLIDRESLAGAAAAVIRLPVPVLAAGETRIFKVALTPHRIGDFRVSALLDRQGQSLPVVAPILAAAEVPIRFDPAASIASYLPQAPKQGQPIRLPRELSQVPEIAFGDFLPPSLTAAEASDRIAHVIDKIKHVNGKKRDGYLEAMLHARSDLAGLPFVMGEACQMQEERGWQFATALISLRTVQAGMSFFGDRANKTFTNVGNTMANVGASSSRSVTVERTEAPFPRAVRVDNSTSSSARPRGITETPDPVKMMEGFRVGCIELAKESKRPDMFLRDQGMPGRVAVVMQVLTAETTPVRLAMVDHLAGTSHIDATRALAKLAIFSEEDEIRSRAIEALRVRRDKDYSAVLVQGLQYPWPAVARRSSEAIAKLERKDLIPQLLAVLDQPDPRAPHSRTAENGAKETFVRELVRINHLRNCLLCHAPAESSDGLMQALTAPVPIPKVALPAPDARVSYYGKAREELLVRIDVTYLRQDFSVRLPVANADPWPALQRFDFVVRTRPLTEPEAKDLQQLLDERGAGAVSPYHQAALYALRELTGLDAEPTAAAWRKLLTVR